jgi:hypothetical protein
VRGPVSINKGAKWASFIRRSFAALNRPHYFSPTSTGAVKTYQYVLNRHRKIVRNGNASKYHNANGKTAATNAVLRRPDAPWLHGANDCRHATMTAAVSPSTKALLVQWNELGKKLAEAAVNELVKIGGDHNTSAYQVLGTYAATDTTFTSGTKKALKGLFEQYTVEK